MRYAGPIALALVKILEMIVTAPSNTPKVKCLLVGSSQTTDDRKWATYVLRVKQH